MFFDKSFLLDLNLRAFQAKATHLRKNWDQAILENLPDR